MSILLLREHFEDLSDTQFWGFLFAHAGVSIDFPEMKFLKMIDRDNKIADSIDRDPSEGNRRRLSDLHGLPRKEISKTHKLLGSVFPPPRKRNGDPRLSEDGSQQSDAARQAQTN